MSKARDIANSTATLDVDGGTIKLDGNYPVGTGNVALGDTALDAVTTGGANTAIGADTLTANTASNNTAIGYQAGSANTTGTEMTAVGKSAMSSNTTGNYNTAVGYQTMLNNTTGSDNTAYGDEALRNNTSGGKNTVSGNIALYSNTTGNNNTAFGMQSLFYNTTASNNTAVGYKAGFSNTTGSQNLFVGRQAGRDVTTGSLSTIIGDAAGEATTTGTKNTFVGQNAGNQISTGSQNTIIGRYNGNQGGLDIRTSNNQIVISDGDGNPRLYDANGATYSPSILNNAFSGTANVCINATTGFLFRNTSSLRYKKNVVDTDRTLDDVLALRPVKYQDINVDDGRVFGGLIAEEVHDAGLTEFVDYDDQDRPDNVNYANMVSLCIKAIQEQQAIITALEARITALETN